MIFETHFSWSMVLVMEPMGQEIRALDSDKMDHMAIVVVVVVLSLSNMK